MDIFSIDIPFLQLLLFYEAFNLYEPKSYSYIKMITSANCLKGVEPQMFDWSWKLNICQNYLLQFFVNQYFQLSDLFLDSGNVKED